MTSVWFRVTSLRSFPEPPEAQGTLVRLTKLCSRHVAANRQDPGPVGQQRSPEAVLRPLWFGLERFRTLGVEGPKC